MALTLRAARSADLPQVFDLIETAFPEAPRALFTAQTLRDSTFRLRHARVAVVDGAIAAYVRIFARRMLVRGAPVAAGGIGSVATRPDARGNGIATALLEDAITQMRREGVAVSYLFTGIPAFYERLGYRIVRQPEFVVSRAAIVAARAPWYDRAPSIHLKRDLPALLRIYRHATRGATGAVVRTPRTWLDATAWLAETGASKVAIDRRAGSVAYIRSRCRAFGHQILEAECLPGHEAAIRQLLEVIAFAPCDCGDAIVASAPAHHPLAAALRAYATTAETTDVRYPMMVCALGGGAGIDAAFDEEPLSFWTSDRI
ncbi:MAG: GNAT family N-acetyltransferase [Dehalococcoidia bacterium]